MSWTITVDGTTQTLSEWGVSDLTIKRLSGAPDEVDFSQHEQFDATLDFPYGESIILKNGTTTRFVGTIATPTRVGVPGPNIAAGAPVNYKAVGPWDELARIVFEQQWTQETGTASASVVILNQDIDGDRVTTGNQIKEILDNAIAQGANLAYVTADLTALSITVPESQETDIMCAEGISNMLRWHKDITTWFDYTQTTPTIRFSARSSASVVAADLDQADVTGVQITERHDLKVNGVVIRYAQTNSADGVQWNEFTTDSAGTTTGVGVIKMTVQLQGYNRTIETVDIECVAKPDTNEKIEDWLVERHPYLDEDSDEITSITWTSHNISSAEDYILAGGSVPEWANEDVEVGNLFALAKVTYADGTVEEIKVYNEQTFTSASSGTYERESSYTPAEEAPTGLATAIYNQLSVLQYEGSVTIKQSEVDGSIHPGKVLNLTNGQTAWASMNAQIQSVVERPSAGVGLAEVVVTFGPATHLSPQDFVELARSNRRRKPVVSSDERVDGVRGTKIDLTGTNPASDSSSGRTTYQKLIVKTTVGEEPDEEEREIILDPADENWEAGMVLGVVDDEGSIELIEASGESLPAVTSKSEYMVLQLKSQAIPDTDPVEYELVPDWNWIRAVTPS